MIMGFESRMLAGGVTAQVPTSRVLLGPATVGVVLLTTACFSPNQPAGSEPQSTSSGDGETTASSTGVSTTPGSATLSTSSGPTSDVTTAPTSGSESETSAATADESGSGTTGGALCPNGELDAGEACDDGDEINGNGCNNDCVVSGTALWEFLNPDVSPRDAIVSSNGELVVWADGEGGAVLVTVDEDGAQVGDIVVVGDVDMHGLAEFSDGDLAAASLDIDGLGLSRVTRDGVVLWHAVGDDTAYPMLPYGLVDVAIDEDDNAVVAGDRVLSAYGNYGWIGEFDGVGFPGWVSTYEPVDRSVSTRSVDCGPSGDCVVVGYVNSPREGWFRRLSPNGVTAWTRLREEGTGFEPNCVAMGPDGSAFIVGSSGEAGLDPNRDIWMAVYDSDGGAVWSAVYENPSGDGAEGRGCAVDSDGNSVAVGTETRLDLDQSNNIVLLKYSAAGDELWSAFHDGRGGSNDRVEAVRVTDDDKILVVGVSVLGGEFGLWVGAYAP
jgi:cysteine-rich repeat protein